MTQSQAKVAVLARYPLAFVARSPSCAGRYYIAPWPDCIGAIGMGGTRGRAWQDAADGIAEGWRAAGAAEGGERCA
jgi:hypothetical protein